MLRAAVAAALVGAVALPMVRRRLRVRPAAVLAGAAVAPAAAAVLWPRARARAALVCALQMYVYVAAYKMPNDDEAALAARVHFDYPICADRLIGAGELPTVRLQRALHPDGHFRSYEKVLVWAHWVWFATPHATLAYLYACDRPRFTRAAVLTYAVFDTGVIAYWLAPTAPPWYAAREGRLAGDAAGVRRLMVEYGESFWRGAWGPLYSVFGGNPLAAMPSLHFATSTMAAMLLTESGPVAGAVGWAYAGVLGFALVHLGEHYAVDLLGGLALTLAVRSAERPARTPVAALGAAIDRLARLADTRKAPTRGPGGVAGELTAAASAAAARAIVADARGAV
jgi:PAP2 superfamily